jgi:adenosine receptor A2a
VELDLIVRKDLVLEAKRGPRMVRAGIEIPLNVTLPISVDYLYTISEATLAILSAVGNMFVLVVFCKFRELRTVTNYYVISLAVADFLVGLIGIPFAIVVSVGLPKNFEACLFMGSLLMLLCTGSIFSLVAVSIDRYVAIIYPLSYPRRMSPFTALMIIISCWILAALIGILPVLGWNRGRPPVPRCFFLEVIDTKYLVFIYFVTIIGPVIFISGVYIRIYQEVRRQVGQPFFHFLSYTFIISTSLNLERKSSHEIHT